MTFRRIVIVALALFGPAVAHAASDPPLASFKPATDFSPAPPDVAAYRRYVKIQMDLLVGMTRVLKSEIEDGNLQAAQAAYAPAHRYLKRIEPLARLVGDLHPRLDARADTYDRGVEDPSFSGFHRIEHALFAKHTMSGLGADADRLYQDVRALREQTARLDISPDRLFGEAAALMKEVAATRFGTEEPYSRTDLWDLEANVEGVHQVAVLMQPQLRAQNPQAFARIAADRDAFSKLLEAHKEGCGFKAFDTVDAAGKAALKDRLTAVAREMSTLQGALAMN